MAQPPPAPSPDSLYRESSSPEGVATSPGADIYGSPSYGSPHHHQQQPQMNPREDAYGSPGIAIDLSRDMYTQDDIALAPSMSLSPSPDRTAAVWNTTPDTSPQRGGGGVTSSSSSSSSSDTAVAAAAVVDNAPLLFELLARHATQFKDKKVFQFCDDGVTPSRTLTYGELEARTRALALELLSRSGPGGPPAGPLLKRGDRAMLVFLPSLDFILAFIACLRAGITPVPCYPPDPRNLRVNVSLFAAVAASCGAKVALTHAAYSSVVSLASMKETALKWLGLGGSSKSGGASSGAPVWPEHLAWWDVEEATKCGGKGVVGGAGTPAGAALAATLDTSLRTDLAFLQYTSGSTSEPKGVRITHGNLAHNLRVITTSLGAGPHTVVASWLPQYHDMGLIGSYLGVVACGGGGVYMSPLTFLKNPLAWITAMSKYKATHVQAPNFAYALTARRWRDLPPKEKATAGATLNLAPLRHAFNAAEAVTTGAIADFCAAFTPYGLSPKAFSPGYGLAENTVYVSDGGRTVVWVDRETLEEEGRVVVHATAPITALTSPAAVAAFEGAAVAKAAALTAATVATAAAAAATAAVAAAAAAAGGGGGGGGIAPIAPAPPPTPRRIGSFVSCGPISAPPGMAPPNPSAPESSTSTSTSIGGGGGGGGGGSGKNHDVWVLIVDPSTSMPTRSEGQVGEVWVHSPSTAAGYEGKEEATRAAFKAKLAASFPALPPSCSTTSSSTEVSPVKPPPSSSTAAASGGATMPAAPPSPPRRAPPSIPSAAATSAGPILAGLTTALRVPWLRTGDLGFIWHGELYICARVKDLIIIRGRNFYPHDIEEALEEIMVGGAGGGGGGGGPAGASTFLRPGATAAFTLPMVDFVAAAAAAAASAAGAGKGGTASAAATAATAAAAAAAAAASSSGDGADEGLVIVGEVRDGVKESAFPGLVSELKIVCSRDFGIRPTAVLLLKARGTRKTTSGKVARKHNATAYGARMRGGPVGEKNPWGVGNTVVLYEWRSSAGGVEVGAAATAAAAPALSNATTAASSASASGTAVSSAATGATAAAGHPAPPPTPSRPMKDYRSLTGGALLGQLQRDVGEMMNESAWATLPSTTSLFELGLDSLSLAQLPPRFKAEYGFHIGDAQVFSEAFTLGWLVENAGALRVGVVALPEAAVGGGGGGGGEAEGGGSENSGGGGAAAAAATAAAAAAATAAGVRPPGTPRRGGEGGGVSPTTPGGGAQRTPAKKRPNQPSVVEANCPCCLMCIG